MLDRSMPGPGTNWARLVFPAVAILILSFLVVGCDEISKRIRDSNSANTESVRDGDQTNTDTELPELAGKCRNEYYPVDPAAKRNYKMTGSTSGTYTLSQEMAGNDEFKELRVFDTGITVTNNWVCTDEGLRTVEYTNYISMKEGAFDMETLKSSGVTMPNKMEPGQEWTTEYDIRANMKVANMSTSAEGKITITHKLVSLDDKVTAGGEEFTAAKIDSLISMDLRVKGTKVPDPKVKTSNWFAKGVGLVKQEVGGGFGKQTVEYTGSETK